MFEYESQGYSVLTRTTSNTPVSTDAYDEAIFGTAGNDVISIPGGDNVWNDEAYGYDGNDTIMAVSGNTWIQGGAGDDIIFGGADEDRISGGAGSDQLYGGDGDDVYRFDGSVGFDTISDTSGNDTIVIEAAQAVATGEHSIVMALT